MLAINISSKSSCVFLVAMSCAGIWTRKTLAGMLSSKLKVFFNMRNCFLA